MSVKYRKHHPLLVVIITHALHCSRLTDKTQAEIDIHNTLCTTTPPGGCWCRNPVLLKESLNRQLISVCLRTTSFGHQIPYGSPIVNSLYVGIPESGCVTLWKEHFLLRLIGCVTVSDTDKDRIAESSSHSVRSFNVILPIHN